MIMQNAIFAVSRGTRGWQGFRKARQLVLFENPEKPEVTKDHGKRAISRESHSLPDMRVARISRSARSAR